MTATYSLTVYNTIDSSNTECKRRIESAGDLRLQNGELSADGMRLHKTVVAAEEQTAGRGRLGRAFYSPAKTGIYFSIIYVPRLCGHAIEPAQFTVTAAVGVCRAIERCFGKKAEIKWVNDVYLDGKKVCGILTEGVTNARSAKVEAAIIGIGINLVVNENLPVDLSGKVGGILSSQEFAAAERNAAVAEDGPCQHLSPVTARFLQQTISQIIESLDSGEDIIPEYRARSMLKGRTLTVTPLIGSTKEQYEATVIDITNDAGLLVKLFDGTQKVLHSGEVTLHT